MSHVVADMSMSLDGFVADVNDGVDQVFTWYGKPQPAESSQQIQRHTQDAAGKIASAVGIGRELGVIIYGRRTFEVAEGWGGSHPTGAPVIVVSHTVPDGWPHPDNRVTFASGIESALDRALEMADGKIVAVGSPSITQQLLNLGRLDGLHVSLVPVFLGQGIRFFDNLAATPIALDGPIVVEGNGVTQLYYRVPRWNVTTTATGRVSKVRIHRPARTT